MLNLRLLNLNRIHNATFLPYYAQTTEHQLLTNTGIGLKFLTLQIEPSKYSIVLHSVAIVK